MYARWTKADRDAIIDVIRVDLTNDEILEIDSLDDEAFGAFVGRLFAAVKAQLDR